MNKSIIQFFLIIVLSHSIISCNAQQDSPPPPVKKPKFSMVLAKLDTNKDGKISKEEAKKPLKDHFSHFDTNKDGFISQTEHDNAPPPPRPPSR